MKLILMIATIPLLLFCTNNKTASIGKAKEATLTSNTQLNEAAIYPGDTDRKKETMGQLKPLTNKELLALLPDAVGGFKLAFSQIREALEDGNVLPDMGAEIASYTRSDGVQIGVDLIDCVRGSIRRCNLSDWDRSTKEELQEEGNTEMRTTTIDFMGDKALVHIFQRKGKKKVDPKEPEEAKAGLVYIVNGRLFVILSSNREDIDLLKDFAKKLNIKV